MKEKCFADRKDGECHALVHKECEGCSFYLPRKLLKNNPFYEYSYENQYKFVFDTKSKKIPKELIMGEDD